MTPRECYWCHKALTREEYKNYLLNGISICNPCDISLTKTLKGVKQ